MGLQTYQIIKSNACGFILTNYDDGNLWITIYLPLGSLCKIYPIGGYPFVENDNPELWMKVLNDWLKEIAFDIYEFCPFTIAIIGFESDYLETKELFLIHLMQIV
ncbi:MAG: hypothetical protein H6613_20225 [Ignavibacteriales bacterium]|nr:hypothetical protein [Ignavibacteriales bacterium]